MMERIANGNVGSKSDVERFFCLRTCSCFKHFTVFAYFSDRNDPFVPLYYILHYIG